MSNNFQPKISVIVPMYNVEKYVAYALTSLQKQTYKNLEIIVVNDGSPDGALAIAEKFAKDDARIKVISRKNGGLSAARNTGIHEATGRYIGFLDADDYIHPLFYELLVKKIKQDPKLEMVSFETKVVTNHQYSGRTDAKEWNINKGKFKSAKQLYRSAIRDQFGNITARIIKQEIWKKVPFREGIAYEDVDVVERLYKRFSYGGFLFPETLSYYFKNNQGISKKRNMKAKFSRFQSFVRNEKIAQNEFPDDFEHCHNRTVRDVKSILRWRLYYKQLNTRQHQYIKKYVKDHKKDFSIFYSFLALFL